MPGKQKPFGLIGMKIIFFFLVLFLDHRLEFERPMYSNDELLQSVQTVPRWVNNNPKEAAPQKEEEIDY